MTDLLVTWLIMTVSVLVAAYLLPGVRVASFGSALVVAVLLGVLNAILRPVLIFFTLPLTILTFGLFILVINAIIVLIVGSIVKGFEVKGFITAVLFSVILSIAHWILQAVIRYI
ncbi:phage holin family protein [Candidatus Magnetominusculus xianensis]|nr:phage holin family protein [Candidatus Magnetominusculus xianensis]MBF0405691.1 phage holin family protein [Nitrospirota bacterium]